MIYDFARFGTAWMVVDHRALMCMLCDASRYNPTYLSDTMHTRVPVSRTK
jgi:hypothetical protein